MSRTVRTTATALILRTLPSPEPSTDTGKRLQGGQTATVHGLSLDGKWLFVASTAGAGWASAEYLENVADAHIPGVWRTAESLKTLLRQVDRAAPKRKKTHDGTIGDRAHASRKSDHNPNDAGVVTALDITHDPENGCDCAAICSAIVRSRDPRVKYLIYRGRICSSKVQPWVWRPYKGANQHDKHLHLSVDANPALYDEAAEWSIR